MLHWAHIMDMEPWRINWNATWKVMETEWSAGIGAPEIEGPSGGSDNKQSSMLGFTSPPFPYGNAGASESHGFTCGGGGGLFALS